MNEYLDFPLQSWVKCCSTSMFGGGISTKQYTQTHTYIHKGRESQDATKFDIKVILRKK